MNPKQDRAAVQRAIRLDLDQRATRPPAAVFPRKNDEGKWHAPDGGAITLVFVVHRDRPPEQEGTATTVYYCAAARTYWLHEGGGLSGYDAWFGPFRLDGAP